MKFLSHITSPLDLKKLSESELVILAQEMRQCIIDVMAVNGGHLGSNMGVVELLIALHRTFSSPEDKFIFDVGHQSYPHKMLTGRLARFPTVRQYKGLSGFTHPEESIHDHFFAGHAATALSLGLGMAKTRDLNEQEFHVLPIVGDATFTCGLALEALNNLPSSLSKFIVVLNDNNMSISHNVGAIPQIFNNPHKSKVFFEQFGFHYVGPVDGHDLLQLLEVLEKIKNQNTAIALHVLTKKGKGLEAAEKNPILWHGCVPFDKVTGLSKPSSQNKFPQIFSKHLLKMVKQDSAIVTITPATPLGSGLTELLENFPERSIDVGIAEGHAVTYAGGIAKDRTKKVVCVIYASFLLRAFDNLFHDVCLQKLPVLFALDRSGLATGDGATHHGIYDVAFLNAMPNMVICQPRNGHMLKELMDSAFDWQLPTAIRYPNTATEEFDRPLQKHLLGKGEILEQGEKIAIIVVGYIHVVAKEVCKLLQAEGFSPTLIDPIFIKPLDEKLFQKILKTHRYVATIEEHAVNAGFGLIFNTFALTQKNHSCFVRNFGIPPIFIDHGSYKDILLDIGLDASSITLQILEDVKGLTDI